MDEVAVICHQFVSRVQHHTGRNRWRSTGWYWNEASVAHCNNDFWLTGMKRCKLRVGNNAIIIMPFLVGFDEAQPAQPLGLAEELCVGGD